MGCPRTQRGIIIEWNGLMHLAMGEPNEKDKASPLLHSRYEKMTNGPLSEYAFHAAREMKDAVHVSEMDSLLVPFVDDDIPNDSIIHCICIAMNGVAFPLE